MVGGWGWRSDPPPPGLPGQPPPLHVGAVARPTPTVWQCCTSAGGGTPGRCPTTSRRSPSPGRRATLTSCAAASMSSPPSPPGPPLPPASSDEAVTGFRVWRAPGGAVFCRKRVEVRSRGLERRLEPPTSQEALVLPLALSNSPKGASRASFLPLCTHVKTSMHKSKYTTCIFALCR